MDDNLSAEYKDDHLENNMDLYLQIAYLSYVL